MKGDTRCFSRKIWNLWNGRLFQTNIKTNSEILEKLYEQICIYPEKVRN